MNNSNAQSEFSWILKDVKEQILYLQELGVGQLEASLPEINMVPEVAISGEKREIMPDQLEKYIPKQDQLKATQSTGKAQKPARRKREGLFNSMRLSNLQATSKAISDETPKMPLPKQKIETEKKPKTIPNETEMKEPIPTEIPSTLPETSETLAQIHDEIGKDCSRCKLCEERTQVVNSVGNPNADLMFIGEAPGADEDEKGEPFIGRAGKLLTKIIGAIQLKREDVFIGNINRCRPPGNRQPQADEAKICRPYLLREIAVVRPKVIVVMGNTACHNLLDTKTGITKLRGSFKDYFGVKVMPTFHPAYLLRDPRKKREVWEDMKTVRDYLTSTK